LSEEPLVEQVRGEIRRTEHSNTKLKLLAEGLVLWDKNSAWLGVTEQQPFSTLRLVADRIWIYRYGLCDYETAVKVTSTLAYGLRRLGRWAGAMECLRWALQQNISDAAKRDLAGALAGLLAELGEHQEAIEQYQVCAELDERLAASKDSQAHRDGTLALSMLSVGDLSEGEAQIKKALKDLKEVRHVGFQLQLLSRLAEYYIRWKRISEAEQTVNEAFALLEDHPDTYDGQRRRFKELNDFLDARRRFREIVRKDQSPLFELVGGAAEALENNQRVNALVLIVAALETITLAMWLARKDQILGNRVLARRMPTVKKGKQDQLKLFPPPGEWKELGKTPDLEVKNWVLHELGAYDSDGDRNDEISHWIENVKDTRNKIVHGHPASEKVRYAINRLDTLYSWYRNVEQLLLHAQHDVDHFYRNLL
jgi:tetratricopeptide (TPR) repeat protein